MGYGQREEKEKGLRGILLIDELEGFGGTKVVRVESTSGRIARTVSPLIVHDVPLQRNKLVVSKEEFRIIIVCMPLAEVAEKVVKALSIGMPGRSGAAQPPLADQGCLHSLPA